MAAVNVPFQVRRGLRDARTLAEQCWRRLWQGAEMHLALFVTSSTGLGDRPLGDNDGPCQRSRQSNRQWRFVPLPLVG